MSRGIIYLQDQPATPHTFEVLGKEEDINVSDHRSKKIDRYTILSSDLIFVMEEAHKEYITKIEPTAEARIFPLRKFLPPESEKDIVDPISKPYEVYEEVFFCIKTAIGELMEWLS